LLEICENPFNPFNPWRKILSPALSLRGTKQSNHIIFSYFFVFPTQEESHYFFVNCLVWFLLRRKDKRVINSVKSVVKKTFSICQSEFISDSNLSSLDAETSSAWQNGNLPKVKNLWPETKGRTDEVICGENLLYLSIWIYFRFWFYLDAETSSANSSSAWQNDNLWKSKRSKNLTL
jgi:hypothetical protein